MTTFENAVYDSRDIGPPYRVEYQLNGRIVGTDLVADPFMRASMHICLWDRLRNLFGRLDVTVSVRAPSEIENAVMELDANAITYRRRDEWNAELQRSLEGFDGE